MIKLIRELAMGCMLSLVFVSCSEDTRKFQSNTFAELDSFVSSVEGNGGCMGAISVYDGTEEAYGRSWGYSNVMNQVPNGEETCYRLGSVSNLYTAVVVMKLIEDGKLSLDSKLSEFFPSIVQAPAPRRSLQKCRRCAPCAAALRWKGSPSRRSAAPPIPLRSTG